MSRWAVLAVGVMLVAGVYVGGGAAELSAQTVRPFPATIDGIHVFNDQIDVHNLSDAQAAFAATHYAGTQKLTLSGAQRLRSFNPDLVVLHYRLGLGLGYRTADANCQPTGAWLHIISGDEWVQEWPGDDVVDEDWLYHRDGQRVSWCAWGWYLADTDQAGWRGWWGGQVLDQLAANDNDGLFADSVTVPSFLGSEDWRPALPAYDEAFEAEWTRRINDWLAWANETLGEYVLIVNAGQLVTSREVTDYSRADGVMVEGFAGWGEYERFEFGDWQLQMDRVLALVNQDRIVIAQSYVSDPSERIWTLANYLLIKGDHTYINLDISQDVEWFPEYELPIGYALDPLPETVQELQNVVSLYAREYSNGLVLVNPDPAGTPITLMLDGPMQLVTGTVGGGDIPEDADISGWRVELAEVTTVTVQPGQAAVLLRSANGLAESTPVAAAPAEEPVAAAVPTGQLTATHRSGQTFLTWPEVPGDATSTYRVYRSAAPITMGNLESAQVIAEVPQWSGVYWTERARAVEPPYEDGAYRSLRNYVIDDLGPELVDGTGLFVWTAQEAGAFYYAVQLPNGTLLTAGPVNETPAGPQPVLAWRSPDGNSRVYTQFMNYAAYNPTYDAPRAGNYWMGLPNWAELEAVESQQYAYNYWVGLPTVETCGEPVPDELPLILHIEGWGTRYAAPDSAPYGWCAVHVWADDPNQSWYFGFSATHNYHSSAPVTSGPIVNYTEARLMQTLREVIQAPDLPAIDENRIYVYGHSMGGTGALMLAQRYPQVFAAAAASQPMMNYATAELWLPELESKWGARALNLPVEIRGSDAVGLAAYQGTSVWDWQNLGEQLSVRRGDEMAFIAIAHGTADTVIDWETVARPSYAHFYLGNRAFIAEITPDDHTWLGFRYHPNWYFDELMFRKDESLPAFSNASRSLGIPPDGVGGYNLSIEWSASWNDFAGPPVDTPDEWAVVLRSLDGAQTVSVTPRRLQAFEVAPGTTYTWQTERLEDGVVLQTGEIMADVDGLLTVEGVVVGAGGNRLVIR
ncbi:MAG: prolyl oligopeptidase family serine peptidase [Chloroflexi bacterium]|nr:prolyl oligopeptidase family serine peptidase [Chloroflexota bacterium]